MQPSLLVWELRVVGWDVSYGAEFLPSAEGGYTVIVQKTTKLGPADEPVISNSYRVGEAGKIVLTIDNLSSKKKKILLYRSKTKPVSDWWNCKNLIKSPISIWWWTQNCRHNKRGFFIYEWYNVFFSSFFLVPFVEKFKSYFSNLDSLINRIGGWELDLFCMPSFFPCLLGCCDVLRLLLNWQERAVWNCLDSQEQEREGFVGSLDSFCKICVNLLYYLLLLSFLQFVYWFIFVP